MVAGGIFAGFFLLAIEIAFKRRKERQEKDIQVSRNALVHWRKRVEVNLFFFHYSSDDDHSKENKQRSISLDIYRLLSFEYNSVALYEMRFPWRDRTVIFSLNIDNDQTFCGDISRDVLDEQYSIGFGFYFRIERVIR